MTNSQKLVTLTERDRDRRDTRDRMVRQVVSITNIKFQALVYDILPWRKVPESGARSVNKHVSCARST